MGLNKTEENLNLNPYEKSPTEDFIKKTAPNNEELKKIDYEELNRIVQEVINGDWGAGEERIEKAGYDYKTIQAEVNAQLKGETTFEDNSNNLE